MSRNCRPPPCKHPAKATANTHQCKAVNASDGLIARCCPHGTLEMLNEGIRFMFRAVSDSNPGLGRRIFVGRVSRLAGIRGAVIIKDKQGGTAGKMAGGLGEL